MKSLFCISAAILLSATALAARADTGECAKYKASYDVTYCFAKLFLESDKELNTVYSDLRGAIKEPVKQTLKQTQLDWIKYRNAACEESGSINVDCNYRVNRERTEYLRDRLRECRAGTCRDDMIARHSWN